MSAENIEQMTARARSCLDNNQIKEAKDLYARICKQDDANAEAWLMLGAINGETGIFDESVTCVRRAIAIDSGYSEAHLTLAQLLRHQGDLNGALAAARAATESDPAYHEAFQFLSAVHGQLGNYPEAEAASRKVTEITPANAEAHINLGNTLSLQGEYRKAIAKYEEATALAPQSSEAYLALGNAYKAINNRNDARINYARAIEFKPGYLHAHYSLGILEEETGNLDEALACYDEVIRLSPDNIEAQAARASVFEKKGATETAYGIIRPLLDRGIQNAKLGTVYAILCKYYDDCPDASRYLENLGAMPALTDSQRANIHYSLGTLADRMEHYDDAFMHFKQANDNISATYDPVEYTRYVDSLIAANSASSLKTIPVPATSSNRPVFIVGMPRSGTTLVEQIISAHPQVFGGGELEGIFRITEKLQSATGSGKPYPACIGDMDQAVADAMASQYLEFLQQINSSAEHVTDKMLHNFQHLGLIHALFPRAPLIHVMRNPLDTCLSGYFHHFGGHHPYTYKLEHLACHYRQYQRLMRHWQDELGLPILDVNYEELVADPEVISRQIIDYCGLDWDVNCLNPHASGRLAKTASYAQVRQPIHTGALGRWRHYKHHIEPLLEQFREAAGG